MIVSQVGAQWLTGGVIEGLCTRCLSAALSTEACRRIFHRSFLDNSLGDQLAPRPSHGRRQVQHCTLVWQASWMWNPTNRYHGGPAAYHAVQGGEAAQFRPQSNMGCMAKSRQRVPVEGNRPSLPHLSSHLGRHIRQVSNLLGPATYHWASKGGSGTWADGRVEYMSVAMTKPHVHVYLFWPEEWSGLGIDTTVPWAAAFSGLVCSSFLP
jgi:hypothetical protein